MNRSRSRLRVAVLWAIMVSILYGSSYQQFRFFNTSNMNGLCDSTSYLEMSHGNYDVSPVHRYRPVIPLLASQVQKALGFAVKDPEERDKLSFFSVNFILSLVAAILLRGILGEIGFGWEMSLLGVIFFLTSRVTVASVGSPLVDSIYYLSIAAIVYLTLRERVTLLAILLPLLVVSKETIVPFLFLPFAKPSMRNWRLVISIVLALGVFYSLRRLILPASAIAESRSLLDIIYSHLPNIVTSLQRLVSLEGVHDLFSGFSLLAVIAMFGIVLDRKAATPRIPAFLLLIFPVAFATALLSGNMGRMLFASYVPLIAYTLVGIEYFCTPVGADD